METKEIGSNDIRAKEIAIAPEEENLLGGCVFGETYCMDHSKLARILDLIETKGCKEFDLTYHVLLSNGIYIFGKMNLFLMGEGSKDETGYIARLVDGAVISKRPSQLYLQRCETREGREVCDIRPNLVRLLREFIV